MRTIFAVTEKGKKTMTDNEAKREKTFEEELPYVEERIR